MKRTREVVRFIEEEDCNLCGEWFERYVRVDEHSWMVSPSVCPECYDKSICAKGLNPRPKACYGQ